MPVFKNLEIVPLPVCVEIQYYERGKYYEADHGPPYSVLWLHCAVWEAV